MNVGQSNAVFRLRNWLCGNGAVSDEQAAADLAELAAAAGKRLMVPPQETLTGEAISAVVALRDKVCPPAVEVELFDAHNAESRRLLVEELRGQLVQLRREAELLRAEVAATKVLVEAVRTWRRLLAGAPNLEPLDAILEAEGAMCALVDALEVSEPVEVVCSNCGGRDGTHTVRDCVGLAVEVLPQEVRDLIAILGEEADRKEAEAVGKLPAGSAEPGACGGGCSS